MDYGCALSSLVVWAEEALLTTVGRYRRLAERTAQRLDFAVFDHDRAAVEMDTILRFGSR
ncbi:hypothetical protein AB0M34_35450 [Nocardia sp. NPDC050193]